MLLKNIIKGWSPKWATLLDQIMPTPEAFQKNQLQTAIQAVMQYVKMVVQNAKITNTPPEFDPRQLVAAIQQAVAESVTPPPKEVIKEREANAQPV
jgi:hypothetical protein